MEKHLIDNLIMIGLMPNSDLYWEFIGRYKTVKSLTLLCPDVPILSESEGNQFRTVTSLSTEEKYFLLSGISSIYGFNPGRNYIGEVCMCNFAVGIMVPIKSYCILLRDNPDVARKAWKCFIRIMSAQCQPSILFKNDEIWFDNFIKKNGKSGTEQSELSLEQLCCNTADLIERAYSTANGEYKNV